MKWITEYWGPTITAETEEEAILLKALIEKMGECSDAYEEGDIETRQGDDVDGGVFEVSIGR